MNIEYLGDAVDALIGRMSSDGYSAEMVKNARWVLGNFEKWCGREGVASIGREEAGRFLLSQFDLPIDERDVTPAQCVVRKPLLTLLELDETGTYLKSHQQHPGPEPPPGQFAKAYEGYAELVRSSDLAKSTKATKLWRFRRFLAFLDARGVRATGDLEPSIAAKAMKRSLPPLSSKEQGHCSIASEQEFDTLRFSALFLDRIPLQ